MIDYVDLFSDVRPALSSWNKFPSTMVYSFSSNTIEVSLLPFDSMVRRDMGTL